MTGEAELEEVFNEIEELTYSLPVATRAETLEARALGLPPGARGRAEMLTTAADWFGLDGRLDDALRCAEAGLADGTPTNFDARIYVLMAALDVGLQERADEMERELRRLLPNTTKRAVTILWVADVLKDAGRLREALRWYSMGLGDVDPADLDEYDEWAMPLLHGRWRVRRELGAALDGYDLARERLLDEPVDD
jgi:tetratricopeptide (TPR) repeat protein